jgi:hypothetical protein
MIEIESCGGDLIRGMGWPAVEQFEAAPAYGLRLGTGVGPRIAIPMPRWVGREQCGFCLQLYVYELELRCWECDRPLCPCCVGARSPGDVTCPECRAEGAA